MIDGREISEEMNVNNFFRLRKSDFIPIIGAERYLRRVNTFYKSLEDGSPEREAIGNNDETRSRYAGLLFYNIGIATPIILTIGHILTN